MRRFVAVLCFLTCEIVGQIETTTILEESTTTSIVSTTTATTTQESFTSSENDEVASSTIEVSVQLSLSDLALSREVSNDDEIQLDTSVDFDSPPKIGDTVTLTVTPNTAFTQNNPIVYHISKITASDRNDDTVSAIIYKNPCAFSFIDMEFSSNGKSTDLTQAQSFSLKSFVFPGSTGIVFEIEIKCKLQN